MNVLTSSIIHCQNPLVTGGGPINVINPGSPNQIIDGVFVPTHVPTKRPMQYESIREADYIWSKRVYRRIDFREKINFPLKYPLDKVIDSNIWIRNTSRWSLWTIIRHHIITGDIILYEVENPGAVKQFDGDQFKYPLVSSKSLTYWDDYDFRKKINERYFGIMGLPEDAIKSKDPEKMENDEDSTIFNKITGLFETQYEKPDMKWVDGDEIVGYELKEDWFFDKERSVLDVRIIGIAPVVNWTDEFRFNVVINEDNKSKIEEIASGDLGDAGDGDIENSSEDDENQDVNGANDLSDPTSLNNLGLNSVQSNASSGAQADISSKSKWVTAPLFWIYFPELRQYIANYYVYNEDNDAQWMSFDDFFWKRRFSSYILKESNVFDRQVESYRYGIDALIESEAITEEIRTLEHDMWNF
jgi:hypothetical protein